MDLVVNKNVENSWIWNCPADYSEDTTKPTSEVYALRFTNSEGT